MKAFIIDKYKSKDGGRIGQMPIPVPQPDEVLVEVHATAINLLDSKIRNGEFKLILPYKTPFILGHDVAGVVTKVGSRVKQFNVGDEVYARPADHRIGTFAEFIAVKEAASIPLVGLTAWQALIEKGNLKRGEKVLIQAGSGGVGTFAIQLAKHIGAIVATTTSAANIDLVKSLGADVVIDYRKDDFEQVLNDYNLVLNSQDGKTLEKSLRILKPGGKLISISGPPDPDFAASIGLPWYLKLVMRLLSSRVRKKAKRLNVDYSFLFMKASGFQLKDITALIDVGAITPVVDKVFPFESIKEAIAYVESGRAKGKVVVRMK